MSGGKIQNYQQLPTRRNFLALLGGATVAGLSPGWTAPTRRPKIRIGYYLEDYVRDSSSEERRSVFEVWIRDIVLRMGRATPEATPSGSWNEFERAMSKTDNPPWDVVAMNAYEYLDYHQEWHLEPLFVPEWQNGATVEYSLYVSEASPVTSIRDLLKKNITVEVGGRGELPFRWLANLIKRETSYWMDDPDNPFVHPKPTSSPLRAILPVFFYRPDMPSHSAVEACVVSDVGMAEVLKLNPQISRRLRRLKASPAFLTHIVACHRDLPSELRNDLTTLSLSMRYKSNGNENSIQRMVPFRSEQLADLEKECAEYRHNLENKTEPAPSTEGEDLLQARAGAAAPDKAAPKTAETSPAERDQSTSKPKVNGR